MKRVLTIVAALVGLGILTTAAISQDEPATDEPAAGEPAAAEQDPVKAIKARRHLMKEIVGPSAKLGGQMVKGDVPFDAAKAAEAMNAINGVPDKYVLLFPEGSGKEADPESEASPRIWEDFEGFKAIAMKLKDESAKAAAAAAQGEGAFKAAFTDLTKNCKNCHESYRIKKE